LFLGGAKDTPESPKEGLQRRRPSGKGDRSPRQLAKRDPLKETGRRQGGKKDLKKEPRGVWEGLKKKLGKKKLQGARKSPHHEEKAWGGHRENQREKKNKFPKKKGGGARPVNLRGFGKKRRGGGVPGDLKQGLKGRHVT